MASSMASVSRTICRSILACPHRQGRFSAPFCAGSLSSSESASDDSTVHSDPELDSNTSSFASSPSEPTQQRTVSDCSLENGLDIGVYKAILLGQVGQSPVQKRLKSGRIVTLLSLGTGGIRNNRRPLDNEEPREYANRCAVQWHRVSIYPGWLGNIAMKHAVAGAILYLEGNLETKIFTDPITGLVRRIREITIRRNGRVLFIRKGDDVQKAT